MPRIFMSYRRSDSISESGRIHDHLEREFGGQNVFKDVDDIQPGFDFRQVLDDEVTKCDVLLAIIGPDWATASDGEDQIRLHRPDDFVRIEVEAGLKRGNDVLVIPVLIKNATMPALTQLPKSLQELTYRNAVIIRNDPDFNRDMRRLIDYIRRYAKKKPTISQNVIVAGVGVLLAGLLVMLLAIGIFGNTQSPIAIPEAIETPLNALQAGDRATAESIYSKAQEEAGDANYLEAIDLYSQAIDADPTFENAYVGRALAYGSGFGDYEIAIADLEQAISLDPTYSEAFRYLGRYQYFADEHDLAEANLQHALELNPSDYDAHLWLAEYYTNFGGYDSALVHYEALLEVEDAFDIDILYDIWIGKASTQFALGNTDDSLDSYQTAITLDPNRVEAYAELGDLYIHIDDYESALEFLDTTVDKMSDDPNVFYNRGKAHFRLQGYTEAIADYDYALQLDPNKIVAYVGRGQVHNELGNYELAIADYNQAITRDESDGEVYYLRGIANFDNGDYELAIQDFSTAIELDEFTGEAYAYRGLSYGQLDGNNTAKSDLDIALDYGVAEELQYDVLNELGWIELDSGGVADALNRFAQAKTLRPDQADAYEGEADVFMERADNTETESDKINNWISAIGSLTKGIDSVHDNLFLYYKRGIVTQQLGLLTEDDEQLESAIADFEQVITLDESMAVAYVHLAELALRLDGYIHDDALDYAEIAYQLDASDAYVIGTLAHVHEVMGNLDEAIRYYQLAVDNSDNDIDREYNQGELDRLNG